MTLRIRRRRQINSPFVGGLIMIVIGAGLAFVLSRTVLADVAAAESWPSVNGTVQTAEVKVSRSGDSNSYSARVIYEYSVDGEAFESGKVSFADGGSSRSAQAQSIVDRYQPGATVEVYYNPLVPADSVLEPDAPRIVNILYWAGIGFAIFGIGAILRGLLRSVFRFIR